MLNNVSLILSVVGLVSMPSNVFNCVLLALPAMTLIFYPLSFLSVPIFLDLFAGSGGIGIEALSRGAMEAVFVEKKPKAMACVKENLQKTHFERKGMTMQMDVMTALYKLEGEKQFDYIFMDPPYNHELEKSVLTYLAESSLLAEEGIIIVEASKETDFDYAEDLGYNIIKEKEYKTNKHVFLEPAGRKEIC